MIPREFQYHAPKTLPDALGLLQQLGDEAKVLAGGHSLLPMMKLRFAQPGHLIDLGRIPELQGIREDGGTIRIGAMTSESELIASKVLQQKCPLLVEGARQISDPQVRYKGTIGGDIAHGDPGNDHPALMLALAASFVLKGAAGERVVAADGFFLGTYDTLLSPARSSPKSASRCPPAGSGYCYAKLKRKTGDFATAAAAVTIRMQGGEVADVAIALTNVGRDGAEGPRRRSARCAASRSTMPRSTRPRRLAMSICDPVADQRGDVEYKTAMAGEMTRTALRTARSRAAR